MIALQTEMVPLFAPELVICDKCKPLLLPRSLIYLWCIWCFPPAPRVCIAIRIFASSAMLSSQLCTQPKPSILGSYMRIYRWTLPTTDARIRSKELTLSFWFALANPACLDATGGFDRECAACSILDKVPTGNIIDLVDIAGPNRISLYLSPEHLGGYIVHIICIFLSIQRSKTYPYTPLSRRQ